MQRADSIKDDDESSYVHGANEPFAPRYPVFNFQPPRKSLVLRVDYVYYATFSHFQHLIRQIRPGNERRQSGTFFVSSINLLRRVC